MKWLWRILGFITGVGIAFAATVSFASPTVTTSTLATSTAYAYFAYCVTSTSSMAFIRVATSSYLAYRTSGTSFPVPSSNCTSAAVRPIYNTASGDLEPGSYTQDAQGVYHIPMFLTLTSATGTRVVIDGEVTTTTQPTAATLQQYAQ